jgi:chorismate dehydratase
MTPKLRVGVVPYLNAHPLIEGHEAFLDRAEFYFVPPSQLSAMLAREELDLALLSSVEYLRGVYEILPEVGIVSRGAVNSVLLTGSGPIEEAESVNLDPNSLTSCALAVLWYRLRLGRSPKFSRFPIGSPAALGCDAQLAIGDEGLYRSGRARFQMDLGAAWKEWMGHSFVYAAWLVRKGIHLGALASFLMAAPTHRGRPLAALAAEASRRLGLSDDMCLQYLAHSLQFRLDEEALLGLECYLNLVAENHAWLVDMIPDLPPLGLEPPIQIHFHTSTVSQYSIGS